MTGQMMVSMADGNTFGIGFGFYFLPVILEFPLSAFRLFGAHSFLCFFALR